MKNRTSKEDRLVSEIMKDFKLESPSIGFTESVMQTLQLEPGIHSIDSRPLISTAGRIGIAAGLLVLILIVSFGAGNEPASDPGIFMQRLSSFNLPSFDIKFDSIFAWINLDSPTLFWIFTGIGGIMLFALLDRLVDGIRTRYSFPA